MAKKISKNSRAARQYDLTDLAPKELQNLPRAENTDLTNIMIRTAAKKWVSFRSKDKEEEGQQEQSVKERLWKENCQISQNHGERASRKGFEYHKSSRR